ncbi:protein OCTOPUS-like [Tasmannia lanceolata]|uniref:protein OCTOPUS-like n=1 Tax=Tasmannia lanceolata TaxID=3420 RepID=UPI0040647E5B
MNLEPPPPPQPSRFTSCDRHPNQQVTGFCASCLRERLAGLDPATRRTPSSSSSAATSSSVLKSIFKGLTDTKTRPLASSSSFFPELRRSKSFSGGKGERFSGIFEPQRKSCDVRVRNTLSSLFHLDDENRVEKEMYGEIEVESRNLGFSDGVCEEVVEEGEEEGIRASDSDFVEEIEEIEEESEEGEIRVSESVVVEEIEEIIEEEEEERGEGEVKTMKDHIDLDLQNKNPYVEKSGGSFWLAASVFSKKLQKWRRKQKMKKRGGINMASGSTKTVGKPGISRRFRETQSEVADYGYGRRSCDTDPRFSLDACRISFEDQRYSFDEPRASWDGYLIGGRATAMPRLPPVLSDIEDATVSVPVRRSDHQIPVEESRNSVSDGGMVQTKEYYLDSSSSQRRSLDRSNSVRKVGVVTEIGEIKLGSNSKVSPERMEFLNGNKISVPNRNLRDSNSNSLRDDCSEGLKKSQRWSKVWNIWGLIHRRGGSKDEDDERFCRSNVMQSFSESWPELRREATGDAKGVFNRKVFRSNSSVSSRNSFNNGAFGSMSSREANGNANKKREEFVLERNRSARYSPSNLDNGFLRYYLTPLRSGRSATSRSKNSHSFARSVPRLY